MNWVIYIEKIDKNFFFVEFNTSLGFAKWNTNHKKAMKFSNHDKAVEFASKYLPDKKTQLKAIV